MRVPLFYVAHSRTGDKGDSQTMSLIPYDRADYDLLARLVTPSLVKHHFAGLVAGEVRRYDLPLLFAFNFVMDRALQGGVNDSLALDTHGKSRSSVFLALEIDMPDDHVAAKRFVEAPAEAPAPRDTSA
jgi:hypothetical protein